MTESTLGVSRKPRILVVDDTAMTRETIAAILSEIPADVATANNGEEALKLVKETPFDTVVSDIMMPGIDGLELLREVKKVTPSIGFVLVTGYGNVRDAVTAMRHGASDYLQKPIQNDELIAVVERAYENSKMRREIEDLRRKVREKGDISGILTCSEKMKSVLRIVQDVSHTDATVLITGESGTGKELVARALVVLGKRSTGPFFAVNCAALTESLVESELFGHVRGAFTGAHSDREGILGEADGGTVFLDEVGELPMATQAKLLRFLETGEVQRIGDVKTRIVDVRVLAATNRDLKEEVRAGRYREDLFFRLNVVSVELPPLRERPEDIILLAEHFIQEMNDKHNTTVTGLSQTAKEVLMSKKWQGNVRELRNWIERMVIIRGHGTLEVEDINIGKENAFSDLTARDFSWPDWPLEKLEQEYIKHVLHQVRGNRTVAADKLGISRVTLWRKIKDMEGE
ncbi:MAG: sigma-54-dependent Fis family transcriptional regulator [Candidatus Omnitrophica bacterium]|nr:sigma-54-dependent Fis family transcriptional regulator [Candidatus Omnitrophota bacterium]MCA9429480.1 sigma-54-dependent Fis family transcriptional regulator [Candidatus Omnitrophota bacterium]MCB9766796.1 sigma-54-dependent Fis family transcriptional regulator [Candidatus Omnitrophota bacterium]